MNHSQRLTRIAIERYRCFRDRQCARLAPLTFLVGANSTGKTSFLAILRTVAAMVFQGMPPDFKSDPFDLGTFVTSLIPNGRDNTDSDSFHAKLEFASPWTSTQTYNASVTFRDLAGSPFPFIRTYSRGNVGLIMERIESRKTLIRFTTSRGEWGYDTPFLPILEDDLPLWPMYFLLYDFPNSKYLVSQSNEDSIPSPKDIDSITHLIESFANFPRNVRDIFASSPIRSRPKRTYDPARQSRDPEGEYVPNYLASIKYRQTKAVEHYQESPWNLGE